MKTWLEHGTCDPVMKLDRAGRRPRFLAGRVYTIVTSIYRMLRMTHGSLLFVCSFSSVAYKPVVTHPQQFMHSDQC